MARVSTLDAERVLRLVADAEANGGDESVTPELLVELGELVPADGVTYCEQDRVRKRERRTIDRPGDAWIEPPVSYWEIADEHPICRVHNRGVFRALKLTDFVTRTALRRSHVYDVWFHPAGVEHELSVPLPSPPWHTKTFLFDRCGGRDFSERDKLVLELLKPHLARLWRAARTRRLLNAAMSSLEWGSEHDRRGAIVVAPDARVEFASPAARRIAEAYFGPHRAAELPPPLAEWLESGATALQRRDGERRLTVHRVGDALLLEETRDELGLTARERQILAWVARGKTNPQIAELLWISPSTVRKHLENVYAKLGVRTRTAAVRRFLDVRDDEERRA